MVDRECLHPRSRLSEPTEWHMSNSSFLTAFVGIAAVLTVLALALH